MTNINIPNEIINFIFSFCQGSTNEIMKNHFKEIEKYNNGSSLDDHLIYILFTNQELGFIHFNEYKYNRAYYKKCDYCNCYVAFDTELTYQFENLQFCNEWCEYRFDIEHLYND